MLHLAENDVHMELEMSYIFLELNSQILIQQNKRGENLNFICFTVLVFSWQALPHEATHTKCKGVSGI